MRFFALPIHRLFDQRELLVEFGKRSVLERYKRSVLGLFWTILNPLLIFSVYIFVFSVVLQGHFNYSSNESRMDFGLGIFACVDLATETVRIWSGPAAYFDFVTMATYHCCVVIWLVYLLAPQTAPLTAKELPENNLEQWNAELQRLLLQ